MKGLLWILVAVVVVAHVVTMWIAFTPVLLIGRALGCIDWSDFRGFYGWTARLGHTERL